MILSLIFVMNVSESTQTFLPVFCRFVCKKGGRGKDGRREGRGFYDLSRVLLVFAARREESGIEVGISKGGKKGRERKGIISIGIMCFYIPDMYLVLALSLIWLSLS